MDLNPTFQPISDDQADTYRWPKPDAHLHVSTAVWEASENGKKDGPTVTRALFDAVVELEKAVHDLRGDHRAD